MNIKHYEYDIAIIGGGAGGLAAAVCIAKKLNKKGTKCRVAVIEKELKCGRKLLATGNGKCNITNTNMSPECYNESSREFLSPILSKYKPDKLISFFGSLGLICRSDSSGRVYPYSNQSSTVLDILLANIKMYGVDIHCGVTVDKIEKQNDGFCVSGNNASYTCGRLIIASGGKAQPNLGSAGASYSFAKMLGLSCRTVFPSLAPVPCSDKDLPLVKGVRVPCTVSVRADGRIMRTENGELQLNENNVSGICVFQLSRYTNEFFALGTAGGEKYVSIDITADLMPEYTLSEIERMLKTQRKRYSQCNADELFCGILNRKLGVFLCGRVGIDSGEYIYNISDDEITQLAQTIKNCVFNPSKPSAYSAAQVTAGGISLSETDGNMQSIKHKNLYIIGEALDVDGICGGYNLHFAFVSGIIAGNACADTFKEVSR